MASYQLSQHFAKALVNREGFSLRLEVGPTSGYGPSGGGTLILNGFDLYGLKWCSQRTPVKCGVVQDEKLGEAIESVGGMVGASQPVPGQPAPQPTSYFALISPAGLRFQQRGGLKTTSNTVLLSRDFTPEECEEFACDLAAFKAAVAAWKP